MDDYMFDVHVSECRVVKEDTSYVEMFNYTDPAYNRLEQHSLSLDDFENFLHQKGAFEPPDNIPDGVKLLSAIRLVTQFSAKNNDTFTPRHISLPQDLYKSMVRALRLPFQGIELSAVVGPFFWSSLDEDDDDPHFQILHRKSDVRKKGKTRGWEMMLSHSFQTRTTTGYLKGTPSSDIIRAVEHLKACAAQVGHPMLLSTIILSYDLSPDNDKKQRDAREWLRRLENAVSHRDEVGETEKYFEDGLLEIDGLSRDLVECHSQVMWKRPQAFTALIKEMEKGMRTFQAKSAEYWNIRIAELASEEGKSEEETSKWEQERKLLDKLHRSMLSRMDFFKSKLKGLENYIVITLERLKVQREAIYNIMGQREARLNLEIAGEQRRLAHASKRDSTAMKTISILGAIFLPGNLLASIFGMSFFNFEDNANPVASDLWIFFAWTIPITAMILAAWLWVDRRREARYAQEDKNLEADIEKMERDIIRTLRQRTMSKAHTWNTVTSPVKA